MSQVRIKNPILRGFNPDPAILRVENRYYIVVSSFEWLPGIRLYQSEDLVNWEHITDILTNQINLQGNPVNGSIWAPQLSYSNGLFHLVYTDVKSTRVPFKDTHNYLMTAASIMGPWSEPVYLNSSGFDPSLFHDPDGKKWLLNEIWDYRMNTGNNKSAGIVLQEFDFKAKELVGPIFKIFSGTNLAKTEAPHLYKQGEYYYLLTAEGGTGADHTVTVCRSKCITGPYEVAGESLLTARDKPNSPLQCSGHGSLVETPTGDWYIAYLCTRPLEGKFAVLGRETAIQAVEWTKDGWLKLKQESNGPAEESLIVATKAVEQKKQTDFHDNFSQKLKKEWNGLRIMPDALWCDLISRPNYLRMISGESLQSLFNQHLLAIRQRDFQFEAETVMDFYPKNYLQMAGLILYLDDSNYMYLYLTWDEEQGKVLRFMSSINGQYHLSEKKVHVANETIHLKITANGTYGQFLFREKETNNWQTFMETNEIGRLSGGFTGNFIGLAVHDMGKKSGSYADFHFFTYTGLDT